MNKTNLPLILTAAMGLYFGMIGTLLGVLSIGEFSPAACLIGIFIITAIVMAVGKSIISKIPEEDDR